MTNRNFRHLFAFIVLSVATLLVGCGGGKGNILQLDEAKLATQETYFGPGWRFHQLAHDPRGHSLPFPGLVIGIEKSDKVNDRGLLDETRLSGFGEQTQKIGRKLVDDDKTMAVTHVVDYRQTREADPVPNRIKGCFAYTLYPRRGDKAQLQSYKTCPMEKSEEHGWPALAEEIPNLDTPMAKDGWIALARVRQRLTQLIKQAEMAERPISHILVVVMGWNTAQNEAMNNFASLAGNLYDQADTSTAGNRFNPLMLGLTWPSYWKGVLMNNSPFSYTNKAYDADEVGMSWLGALMHNVLPSLPGVRDSDSRERSIRVVGIGHSFGARTLSRAIHTGPVLTTPDFLAGSSANGPTVDLFVGLQGAYSVNRYMVGAGKEGAPYANPTTKARHTLLTASIHDKAVDSSIWTTFVGDEVAYQAVCPQQTGGKPSANPLFNCVTADQYGKIFPNGPSEAGITYVNADSLIYYNMVGTGGGSHSDIYRPETAHLIWNAIAEHAPVIP